MNIKKYRVPKSAITERGLKKLLKEAAKEHASMSEWANVNGVTPQQVSAFMRDQQSAGLLIPEKLGYRPQTVYLPLDDELICHMNPPRKPAIRPSKKVDHSLDPVEKRHTRRKNEREEAKRRLKKRAEERPSRRARG